MTEVIKETRLGCHVMTLFMVWTLYVCSNQNRRCLSKGTAFFMSKKFKVSFQNTCSGQVARTKICSTTTFPKKSGGNAYQVQPLTRQE